MSKIHRLQGGVLPLCLTLCLIFTPIDSASQGTTLWGDLEAGPYAVGFRTLEQYDFSRTYQSGFDYFGAPRPGETARPIQICIWYPARDTDDMPGMVYGEYAYPFPENNEFSGLLGNLQNRELGVLFALFNNSNAFVHDAMNLQLTAVRDATPVEEAHPLLIYHPGFRSSYCQSVVMCEYLASHGFVVATTHSIGTGAPNAASTAIDLESNARDQEFAVAHLRELPWIDCDRVGVFGFHLGGITALMHQMRNAGVGAVATMQGAYLFSGDRDLTAQLSSFDPVRVTVPLLQIYSSAGDSADVSLVDSMRYSDRRTLMFADLDPLEFTSYALITSIVAPDTSQADKTETRTYDAICGAVLNFFRDRLMGVEAAKTYFNRLSAREEPGQALITTTFQQGEERPPTADQFVYIVRNYDREKIAGLCRQYDLDSPDHPILAGGDFTGLGYQMLQGGQTDKALEIFRMGTAAFPSSANAWDSYGEACIAAGDNASALKYYRRALEILPQDSTINPALRDAIANNVPAVIERLEAALSEQSEGN